MGILVRRQASVQPGPFAWAEEVSRNGCNLVQPNPPELMSVPKLAYLGLDTASWIVPSINGNALR